MKMPKNRQNVVMNSCGLCGHGFGTNSIDRTIDSTRIFAECDEWSKSYEKDKYVIGKPEDLNYMYFDIPWIWEHLHRAIIRTTSKTRQDKYKLSGVTLSCWHWNNGSFQLTSDSGELALGLPIRYMDRNIAAFAGGPPSSPSNIPYTFAYPMHERCWALMTRILDVDLIENNLYSFVQVLYKQIKEKKRANKYLINEQQFWKQLGKTYMNLALNEPARYAEVCERKIKHLDGYLDYAFAPRDPFNIPELTRLLSELEESHQKKVQKETQKKLEKQAAAAQPQPPASTPKPRRIKAWKPRTPRCHRMGLRPSTFDVCRIKAPTEIIIMIMDHLPSFRDIKTLMWVFPQWRFMVPQACLRDRFIRELALNELAQDANALDWRYLYFHADQLLAKSHGWFFRRHVLGSLEKTKVAFLKSMYPEPKRKPTPKPKPKRKSKSKSKAKSK